MHCFFVPIITYFNKQKVTRYTIFVLFKILNFDKWYKYIKKTLSVNYFK